MKRKNETSEKKENKVIANIITILLGLIALGIVIFIYNAIFNNNEYVDLSNPNLIETDDGYKEEIQFNSTVDSKKIENNKKGKKYYIICSNDDKEYEIEVGNYLYTNLSEDEEIEVKGTIYYNKKGLKLSSDYEVKSLVDNDDNGIIDIPDGYKEPEPERVPGVDYGDGVIW